MTVRQPAVAGRFYPAAPEELHQAVEHLLTSPISDPTSERIKVVVAPHAGYPYSGPTAGIAFSQIAGRAPRRVVLLGPSHHFRFQGISTYRGSSWSTPLGVAPVDDDFTESLVAQFGAACPEAHAPEHALEVELPFLQQALAPGFAIVPILTGDQPGPFYQRLAEYLVESLEPDDLIVASTDLSHFLSEASANLIDNHSLRTLVAGEPESLRAGLADQSCAMCGGTAVYTALLAANELGATQRQLWDYRTSAAATGDFERVVGYGAVTLKQGEVAGQGIRQV